MTRFAECKGVEVVTPLITTSAAESFYSSQANAITNIPDDRIEDEHSHERDTKKKQIELTKTTP